jgi:hypothetical protein
MGGAYIAVTNIAAMFGFGSEESPLMQSLSVSKEVYIAQTPGSPLYYSFLDAKRLANKTFSINLQLHQDDPNLLAFVHCILVFINYMSTKRSIVHLESNIPWPEVVERLNSLLVIDSRVSHEDISFPEYHHLFPEDYVLVGLKWAWAIYSSSWFRARLKEDKHDADLLMELKERILFLGFRIARRKFITYDEKRHLFSTKDP